VGGRADEGQLHRSTGEPLRRNTIGLTVAALAAAGAVGVAGAAIASAADDSTPTSTFSTSSSTDSLPRGGEGSTERQVPDGKGGPGASQDEAVTGDEAQEVADAVQAQDSSVTIETVRKDPDGSYVALGTKDGQPVFFDVSADLETISENAGGPGGGHAGGRGGPNGDAPEATGDGGSTTSSDPTDANTPSSV
jgi:hypothetical protein